MYLSLKTKKMVEEARNERNLEVTKEKWERAKEATEKAKENLKDCENTLERAMEQYELALKAKDDALKAKEKDVICQHNEGSYAFIKQQYEVSPTYYKNKQIEREVATGMANPWGVTVSPNGNILFTGWCNPPVTILSPQLEMRCVRNWGSGQGEVSNPFDVTTNNRDEMFISDCGNKRVQILDEHGRFLREIKVGYKPAGICLDEDENVYVTANTNDSHDSHCPLQIIKYNKDGREIKRMISDKFDYLQHLVHHQGKLYVADPLASLIHVVTTELEYVRSIEGGVISKPIGVTIDQHNTLLVAGYGGIVALTLDGKLVAKVAEESIKNARGITTDLTGNIIVCDCGKGRVVKL